MQSKVFLIKSDILGNGDDHLGRILMSTFLRMLGENENKPAKIILWNSGVKLVCEGSEALEYLEILEEKGVEVLACTTCLEYFNLKDKLKIGKPTTMPISIQSIFDFDVVSL